MIDQNMLGKLRNRLNRLVCDLPDDIIYSRDKRSEVFKTSSDPIERFVYRNPPFLAEFEKVYQGDRNRFTDCQRASNDFFSKDILAGVFTNLQKTGIISNAMIQNAGQALELFPFNLSAIQLAITFYRYEILNGREMQFPLLNLATNYLVIDPTNDKIRMEAAETALIVKWWPETVDLAVPVVAKAMIALGDPIFSYGCAKAMTEALIEWLGEHLNSDNQGLIKLKGSVDPFNRLRSAMTVFQTMGKLSAANDEDLEGDKELYRNYLGYYRKLRKHAEATGRVKSEDDVFMK